MLPLCLVVVHWYASLFFQSFYLHRYCSHGMFTMNKWTERVVHFFTFVTQGPSYLNPKAYAILHRRHHQYSDTAKDPHSPYNFKNVITMMINTYKEYDLAKNQIADEYVPEFPLLDKIADSWMTRVFWIGFYIFIYVHFNISWYFYPLIVVHALIGPIQGSVVNWCGHKYGYRNADLPDDSRNSLPWDLLMMGELYQNNHHSKPKNWSFAQRWFEIDPTYPIMRALSFLRIIKKTA